MEVSRWRETGELDLDDGRYKLLPRSSRRRRLRHLAQGRYHRPSHEAEVVAINISMSSCSGEASRCDGRRYSCVASRYSKAAGAWGPYIPRGFRVRAKIDLPSDWTVLDRAFLFWLCTLMWRRQPDWMIQIN